MIDLFSIAQEPAKRKYKPILTAQVNQKGVLDVDTVKGCAIGMRVRPDGGCYGECYAAKTADRYGIDFTTSVSRRLTSWSRREVFRAVKEFPATWYRIGTAGDPSHDWDNTLEVCEYLQWGAAATCARGEKLPQSKLNWAKVDAIRSNPHGRTMKQLAAEYGVHYRTIEKIMYYEYLGGAE